MRLPPSSNWTLVKVILLKTTVVSLSEWRLSTVIISTSWGINQSEITELLTVIELLAVGTPITASKCMIGSSELETVKSWISMGCPADRSKYIQISQLVQQLNVIFLDEK